MTERAERADADGTRAEGAGSREGAVVVLGLGADAVAARVTVLRDGGRRAAGYVGDDTAAAEVMAAELFGGHAEVEHL